VAVTVHESIESDHNKPTVLSQINVETDKDEYDACLTNDVTLRWRVTNATNKTDDCVRLS